ncbi:unnamed protein product [Bursaphelenchus okinawaensis]|uniref:Uncharacterized protein n=1 Tax=Bursaphelenchus okinawaensis TaxID=465554 RepID=A0A811KZL6_9BILA|nr:unnamed protein product [Bursaphelenchus okinawaensis]CAG9113524.1 unnamed protein product [Bursaphelenchus okinawaensis]
MKSVTVMYHRMTTKAPYHYLLLTSNLVYSNPNITQWHIQVNREVQTRIFGWMLLLLWISAIFYMTRDFWFPAAYSQKQVVPTSDKPVIVVFEARSDSVQSFETI